MFVAVPILEMIILIKVGGLIGAIPTIAMVVLTATVGIWLLKLEGLATLRRVQEKMAAGQLPETELLEGIMLIVGGALLLTPGFVTDAFGFVCLIPGLRRPFARWLINRVFTMKNGASMFQASGTTFQGTFHTTTRTADGSFTRTADGSLNRTAEGSFTRAAEGSLNRTAEGSLNRTAEGSFTRTAEGSLNRTAEGSFTRAAEGSTIIDGEFNDESGKGQSDPTKSLPGNEEKH